VIDSTAGGGPPPTVRRAAVHSHFRLRPQGRASAAWLWLLVAIQIAIPASYYLRDANRDDERFAWRMFSGIRLKRCTVAAREERQGERALVPLRGVLHSSWIHALERGRRRVIEQFMLDRCERGAVTVTLERRCQSVQPGRRMAPEVYEFGCAERSFLRSGAEAHPSTHATEVP
jgi:hypothetical protein